MCLAMRMISMMKTADSNDGVEDKKERKKKQLTGVALPVEVLLGVARALELGADLLARRAVGEGHVPVGDVVEEVDLLLLEHQTSGDGVHGGVTPALVEETALLVKGLEVVEVRLGPKPVQVANLKVGPLVFSGVSIQ